MNQDVYNGVMKPIEDSDSIDFSGAGDQDGTDGGDGGDRANP